MALRLVFAFLVLRIVLLAAGEPAPAREEFERQKKQIYALTAGLRDTDLAKVQAAVDAIVAAGFPMAAPYLWALYDAGDGARRRAALEALSKLKAPGQEERYFLASLADPLLAIRRLAADNLARVLGRDRATDRYIAALENPAKTVPPLTAFGLLRAVQLVAHVRGAGATLVLRALLREKEPNLVIAACDGLGSLRDTGSAAALIELAAANHLETAPAATDALERISGLKHGRNLVSWRQWQESLSEEKPAESGKPNEGSGSDESYVPDKRDPYAAPVEQSAVDFAVIFDTTGSMTNIWPELSSAIDGVISDMAKKTPSFRLASVRYRASDPRNTISYLIQPKPLTRKLQDAKDFILDATFGGGSGGLHLGLQHAIASFAWRASARKVLLVVGDTTPSDDGLARVVAMAKEGWEQDGIIFNALFVRTLHGDEHQPSYKFIAQAGAGRFYEYNKKYRHLVDLTPEKVDPKKAELTTETYPKWLTPVRR